MPTGLVGIHAHRMAGTAIKSGHGALQMMKCSCNPANNRETPEETSPAAGEVAQPGTTSGYRSASSSPCRWPCRSATPPSRRSPLGDASVDLRGRLSRSGVTPRGQRVGSP